MAEYALDRHVTSRPALPKVLHGPFVLRISGRDLGDPKSNGLRIEVYEDEQWTRKDVMSVCNAVSALASANGAARFPEILSKNGRRVEIFFGS